MVSFGAAKVVMTLDVRDANHGKDIISSLRKIYGENTSIKVIEHY
jgi:hypothetical protein